MVNMNDNEKPSTKKADQAKFRKVSIDINYVYEQQQESKPSRMNIHDEKLNDNETGNCQITLPRNELLCQLFRGLR